jgi:GAF domain-containing protein
LAKQKLKTDDFLRKLDIARENGEQFIAPDLRQEMSLQVIKKIEQLDRLSLSLEQFAEEVVNLIRDQFGLYLVSLYLLNDESKWAALLAGSGEIGQLAKERRVPIFLKASDVPVSKAIQLNEVKLVDILALWLSEPYRANPHRPDTRLEMALPLRAQQKIIGALQICSCIPDSLSSSDIAIFMPIADQIASLLFDLIQKRSG